MKLIQTGEFTAAASILILSVIFQALNPNYLSPGNISAMLRAAAYPGLITAGMALCLISGLIDISVGSLAGLVSCVFAWLLVTGNLSFPLAAVLSIMLGVFASLINVTVILKLHITALIATVGSLYILRGAAYWISGGNTIYPLPPGMAILGDTRLGGVSLAFWLFVATIILGEIALRGTVWGVQVRATGSDREIARDTEVSVDMVNYTCFAILGALTALSGILISLRTNGGSVTAGLGYEFRAIVGCALGGVSLFGHDGSLIGAALGIILAQVIATGLISTGLPASAQDIVLGVVLIGVIAADIYKRTSKVPNFEKE